MVSAKADTLLVKGLPDFITETVRNMALSAAGIGVQTFLPFEEHDAAFGDVSLYIHDAVNRIVALGNYSSLPKSFDDLRRLSKIPGLKAIRVEEEDEKQLGLLVARVGFETVRDNYKTLSPERLRKAIVSDCAAATGCFCAARQDIPTEVVDKIGDILCRSMLEAMNSPDPTVHINQLIKDINSGIRSGATPQAFPEMKGKSASDPLVVFVIRGLLTGRVQNEMVKIWAQWTVHAVKNGARGRQPVRTANHAGHRHRRHLRGLG